MQGNVNIPDSTITTNLSFRQLVLMNMQQLTNFPYIEKDFDALTDYELLSLVVKFLNDVIANQNEQNDSITRMYQSFLALQTYVNNTKDTLEDAFNNLDDYVRNYFANLDVQEEINNKLDQMLEDGVLTEIIQQFLQSTAIWCFDNVADMKQATNLIDGSYAKTLGYYSINDGGGATYKITNTASETEYQEELENGLFATLIIDNDSVNVHQFGAKGDGTTDDSNAINLALSSKAYNISFKKGDTYMVRGYETGQPEGSTTGLTGTTGLIIPSNKNVDLNESTIKCITNSRQNYNVFTIAEKENIILKNGTIIGDRATHTGSSGEWGYGVSLRSSSNITLDNLKISECWGDGINLNNNGTASVLNKNITINNCICDSNRRQGMSVENGDIINVYNSQFNNTGNNSLYTLPGDGVDVEPSSLNNVSNVIFDNCLFKNNRGAGLVLDGVNVQLVKINNCRIIDNNQTDTSSSLAIINASDIEVIKCNGSINGDNFSVPVKARGNVIFKENKFKNLYMSFDCPNMNNSIIRIEDNYFNRDIDLPWNFCLQTIGSNSGVNNNNTIIVKNNTFITNSNINVSYISFSIKSGFKKVYIENNLFKYGNRAIGVATNNFIKNNIIIATSNNPLWLISSAENDQPNYISNIIGNIIQEPSYSNNNAGIILNSNNQNIILKNNINYKNCLSSLDQQTRTYSPVRWFQNLNPTGVTLDDGNDIIDNTFE